MKQYWKFQNTIKHIKNYLYNDNNSDTYGDNDGI